MSNVTGNQSLYLLGHPIGHSKSPAMYNAVYSRMGLPWNYEPADCPTEIEAQAFIQERDFLSVNITTPYKRLAYELASANASSAKIALGANVLVRKGEALLGYNTDGQGCISYLERAGFSFAGKRVVVCGTGSTALSIMHACAIAGVDIVLLLGRDAERTRCVLEGYIERFGLMATATLDFPAARSHHRSFREAYERTSFKFGSYESSLKALASADLIINATPVGMKKQDLAPFDTSVLRPGQTVFDAVYGHGETALISAARKAGCKTHDGAGMLVAQAVATMFTVCDLSGVEVSIEEDEAFEIMAQAAQFSL